MSLQIGKCSLHKKCPYSKLSAFFPHFLAFRLNMERYCQSKQISAKYSFWKCFAICKENLYKDMYLNTQFKKTPVLFSVCITLKVKRARNKEHEKQTILRLLQWNVLELPFSSAHIFSNSLKVLGFLVTLMCISVKSF